MLKAIDLFAGLGGWTLGARQAGCRVVWAANHWPAAVEFHSRNHPETAHACQDLHQVDWSQVPNHDLLLASPSCQGHSRARGKDRPHHDGARSTAWAVVSCAEFHRPPALIVENVTEFSQWILFPAWRSALEALGYSLSINIIDAADCGVPQNRRRAFVVGTRSKHPMPIEQPDVLHIAASRFIQFDTGRWLPVHRPGRSLKTLERYAAGRQDHGERFLMPFYGNGSGRRGRSLDRPIGTITTLARWAVVDGRRMRMLTIDETREAMAFPVRYSLPASTPLAIHLLGNAVCPPVARHIVDQVSAKL